MTGPTQVDGAPDDLRKIIHPHWERYPPQNPILNTILAYFYFLFWIINGFGNSTVIVVFIKYSDILNNSESIVLNVFG